MKKNIVILGSTGSIGKNTIKLIKNDKKKFAKIIAKKKPPNIPAYVLLGLIFVSFGPLRVLPNM